MPRRYHFDILQREYDRRRITLEAYGAAERYRTFLEAIAGKPVEGFVAPERLEARRQYEFVRSELGASAEVMLRRVLLGRETFTQLAGPAADRYRVEAVAREFREICEDLAKAYFGHRAQSKSRSSD